VVFLVALPLCLGIAMASGTSPTAGLVASIVGGLFVGAISGAPLQVSGPAAGLTVVIWNIVGELGVQGVGAVVLLAGVMQAVAAQLGFARFFRAVSPAVVYGMLAGIGVLLCASQLHVMLDGKPQGSGLANLATLPHVLGPLLWGDAPGSAPAAAGLGLLTIVSIVAWDKLRPNRLRAVPAALVGVLAATAVASLSGADVTHVTIDNHVLSSLTFPRWHVLSSGSAWVAALSLALIASAETLLCAAAVDRMQTRSRTNYDRELLAQGLGNVLSGWFGGLPITGVIVRSSANIEAGAHSRLSTILHGAWMLLLVALAPEMLGRVPTASLAGMLVYTGVKLVSPQHLRELRGFGISAVAIYGVTLGLVVSVDLLTGVLVGLGLSVLKLVWKLVRFEADVIEDTATARIDVYLRGVLTFVGVPRLAALLEQLPAASELHLHVDQLRFIDHAGLLALRDCETHARARGAHVSVDWQHLDARSERHSLSAATHAVF
jgi:MFS superfamily sulfate permease-like transporter